MITLNSSAIDTNILLYSLDETDVRKQKISIEIIDQNPYISSQNLSEFINVLLFKWKIKKSSCEYLVTQILETCKFYSNSEAIYYNSFNLIKKYDFQLFDAIVVASALEAGCEVLYTEDMHHQLFVNGQLKIINPFL